MTITKRTIALLFTAATVGMSYVTLSIDADRELIAMSTLVTMGIGCFAIAACMDWYDEMRLHAHLRRVE